MCQIYSNFWYLSCLKPVTPSLCNYMCPTLPFVINPYAVFLFILYLGKSFLSAAKKSPINTIIHIVKLIIL